MFVSKCMKKRLLSSFPFRIPYRAKVQMIPIPVPSTYKTAFLAYFDGIVSKLFIFIVMNQIDSITQRSIFWAWKFNAYDMYVLIYTCNADIKIIFLSISSNSIVFL